MGGGLEKIDSLVEVFVYLVRRAIERRQSEIRESSWPMLTGLPLINRGNE